MIQETAKGYKKEHKDQASRSSPYIIRPEKAALYSVVLPGLGQIYNHQAWKVPIVYAALGAAVYGIWWNNDQAQTFLDAFYEQTDPAIENPAFEGVYNESDLINLYYQHRRWKDLSMIGGALAYGLQILDAYVDAHLFYYNINDDLSLNWEPRMIHMSASTPQAAGLGLTFYLK